MEYLPFKVTEYNDHKEEKTIELNSDTGTIWVKIGKLDLEIKQTEDGLGVIVQALDAELCEQDLGSIQIWYEDIQELPSNDDGTHPLIPTT